MNFAQASQSDFFGKDGVTPFIGIVEDVEDPKMAGRVKVRCVGWHPAEKQGEDGLATEDLPWARVGAPTTHAQQNRIGGKHGLLVGSWVYGVFLDGDDANQPFVITSFPMTAKATDKNLKQMGSGESTSEETEDPFGRYIQNKNHPNIGLVTKNEKGSTNFSDENDIQGDGFVSDADGACGGEKAMQSAASDRRQSEMKKGEQGNAEGQEYEVAKADGRCGPNPHAKDDAKRKLKEQMPSQISRFAYNDVVFNQFSGEYMNLNGMMMALAMDLCSLFKFPANSMKAEKEKNEKRTQKADALQAFPDRDGAEEGPRQQADRETTQESDEMHAAFQESFIDILCQLIMQMLQGMNNGGSDSGTPGNDNSEGSGTNTDTTITDWEAECLSEQLVNNIYDLSSNALDQAEELAREKVSGGNGGGGSSANSISGIMSLLMQGMQFVLKDEYAENPEVHNTAGNRSQDEKNKNEGCEEDRIFNTLLGSLPAGGAGGTGGSGGGANSAGGDRGPRDWSKVGFAGYEGEAPGGYVDIPCEDSTVTKEPDPGYTPKPDGGYEPPVYPSYPPGEEPEYVPDGNLGTAIPLPLPSDDDICAKNFVQGRPNTVIITSPGKKYYVNNRRDDRYVYPDIYIPGYRGKPVPVVDRYSGEIVAIITTCSSWGPDPRPSISIIPAESEVGITTDDPNYDIILTGFHIANTGFQYCDPIIDIYDKDARTTSNAKVQAVVNDGRIVDVVILNNGTGFRRIPDVRIYDNGKKCGTIGGHGAVLYPIMSVIPKDNSKPPVDPVEVIYCPAKNFKNLY